MLIPADIVAGKLLVQMGAVDVEDVRSAMRASDADPSAALDVVSRLVEAGQLRPELVSKIRRYQAMFDHVRREAVYLRTVERALPSLTKEAIGDLIARVEKGSYRRRIGAILVELNHLNMEGAVEAERRTRALVNQEDLKVLDRYRQQDFAGVGRPLVPSEVVTTAVFKVSALFRSRETQVRVKRALLRLEEAPGPELPRIGQHEFVPVDVDAVPDELDDESKASLVKMETARFKPAEAPAPDEGLEERQSIAHYEVVECLGQGGMGAVYLAQEHGMGSIVAVKVMLSEKADATDLARFEREIAICEGLHHENAVSLIDEGTTEDGLRFMVIPFYAGKDMRAVLDELDHERMEPADAFHLFEQVLAGMEAVHQSGVVHRDLKPENLFVLAGSERQVKIVDFGIARRMDDHLPASERAFRSRAGVISGSPAFIAPETISDDPIDARTDVYSLGIILYQMLTGRLPLFAESSYDYLREHLMGVPLTLFQGRKDAYWCEGIERLMASMLAKEKGDRPASCQAILDELRGGLRDETLRLYADPPPQEAEQESGIFNSFFKMLGR